MYFSLLLLRVRYARIILAYVRMYARTYVHARNPRVRDDLPPASNPLREHFSAEA